MIHLKKFTLREDWVPIKLDVSVEMPEELDISNLRGKGPQEGESILPDISGILFYSKFLLFSVLMHNGWSYMYFVYVYLGLDPVPFAYNINLMTELSQMGFPEEACRRALFYTNNQGLNESSMWLMEHISDPDFSEPFTIPGTETRSGLKITLF